MYAPALMLSAAATAGTLGIPFFQLGKLSESIPVQWFGLIVAVGVLIGAEILRRYAEWHGVADNYIRGLTGWLIASGFIGAHVFDVVAYQQHRPWFELEGLWPSDWPLILRIWDGISSYGGFLGGAMGFAFYVWWKRRDARLFADIAIVGLLPAFTIGRIGCTVVSDHIGAAVDPDSWQAFFAMPYPRGLNEIVLELQRTQPGTGPVWAWNLGFVELVYLIPVNVLILWLAFRRKRLPAGFVTVLTGVLYAPVRFFLDYLRPENSDPRYLGLTFAQWASLLAFGVAVYVAARVLKNGKAAETIAPTSAEAQEKLRVVLKDAADEVASGKGGVQPTSQPKKVDPAKEEAERKAKELEQQRAEERRKKEEAEEREAEERRRKQDEELAKKAEAKKAEGSNDAGEKK
jgi:phosphatidylglycerol:prolipoprotein diacylglycerol transferase